MTESKEGTKKCASPFVLCHYLKVIHDSISYALSNDAINAKPKLIEALNAVDEITEELGW